MKIKLRKIDNSNRAEIVSLTVSEGQREYIASNESSLAEAEKLPEIARPFGIYNHGKAVGFAMFAFDGNNDDPHDKYWLWRFMIDKSLQGRGYGSAALKEIINYFRDSGAEEITLSTKESNVAALGLYRKFGFKENGEMNGGEIVLKLYTDGRSADSETIFPNDR